jgi:ketosteroid isomerase-like protein
MSDSARKDNLVWLGRLFLPNCPFAHNVVQILPTDYNDLHSRQEEPMTDEANKNNEEAEIKRVIEGGVEALRAKDIDGVMSMYAPELVSFDIVPPLQYVGADAYRKHWEEGLSSFPGPIDYEIADLSITVGDDVAFAHSFNRLSGTLTTGQQIGNWLRWTACFRKIGGKWLIVHMQASVPVDLETGRAVLSLKP